MKSTHLLRVALCALLLSGASAAAWSQSLRVLTAGAFKQVVVALAPGFHAQTGVQLDISNDTAGALMNRVRAGESFDVLVMPPAGLAALGKDGWVDPNSARAVAKVGIGVAVKAGEPSPELATVEQFTRAVLAAKRVAYIDPAAGGSSGIYLDGLFQRLGLAAQVRAKAVLVPGGLVAERVVSGEADLAIHQISEILPVAGAQLVGPLPEAIQNFTTYAAAPSPRRAHAAQARAFLEALSGPQAREVLKAKGMQAASP